MQVDIRRVVNPGTPAEKEIPVSAGLSTGLVVTPARFALAAGATQQLRIVNLYPVQTEGSYRVYIRSKNGEIPDQTLALSNAKGQTIKDSVGINLIWGVVVNLSPSKPVVSLQLDKNSFVLRNRGNMHARINRVGMCNGKECQWTEIEKNIYPDAVLDLTSEGKNHAGTMKIEFTNPINDKKSLVTP
jgi:P pilus assembly chaperone PapD